MKINERKRFKYYYSGGWYLIYPDGHEEFNGGDKSQVEFHIDHLSKTKCYCEKCGNEFQVPEHSVVMIYACFCKPCIKKGLTAYAKLSVKQVIEMECKSLGL